MRLGRLFAVAIAGAPLLAGSAGAAEWRVPGDFPTIQAAIDSSQVVGGDTILVRPGWHAGATVTKAVTIRGVGRANIVDGPVVSPAGKAGFYFATGGQGSGATITGFYFDRVAFPVFSRGADDVSVTQNTIDASPGRHQLGLRLLGQPLGDRRQHPPQPAHELRRRHRHPGRRLPGRHRLRERDRPQQDPRAAARPLERLRRLQRPGHPALRRLPRRGGRGARQANRVTKNRVFLRGPPPATRIRGQLADTVAS